MFFKTWKQQYQKNICNLHFLKRSWGHTISKNLIVMLYGRMASHLAVTATKHRSEFPTTLAYNIASIKGSKITYLTLCFLPFLMNYHWELLKHMSANCHWCTGSIFHNKNNRCRHMFFVFLYKFSSVII